MKRRLLAALAALVLAAVSVVLVLSYVKGADSRALAGQEPTTVLVVLVPIAQGTPAELLDDMVAAQALPAAAVVPGALTDLDSLAGTVATTDLEPGEQVLSSRFSDPTTVGLPGSIATPVGMQQVTVGLDSQRALGGNVASGNTVAVFISFPDAVTTHLVLHQVLVTRVQGGIAPPTEDPDGTADPAAADAGAGSYVMVTVALVASDAELLVFGAEHGSVWLGLENSESTDDGIRVVTPQVVYE